MTPRWVEQVFLEPGGGGQTVTLVLEDEAGARTRERLPLPLSEPRAALRQVAMRLSARGIRSSRRLRLRVSSGGGLRDDQDLREFFLTALGAPEVG